MNNELYSNPIALFNDASNISFAAAGLALILGCNIKDERNAAIYDTYEDLASESNIDKDNIEELLDELEELKIIVVLEEQDKIFVYINPRYFFKSDTISIHTVNIFYGR